LQRRRLHRPKILFGKGLKKHLKRRALSFEGAEKVAEKGAQAKNTIVEGP
jgi:predicted Rossmann fold nucleotide-binding protein DprA/Smf involved in DNA uptake